MCPVTVSLCCPVFVFSEAFRLGIDISVSPSFSLPLLHPHPPITALCCLRTCQPVEAVLANQVSVFSLSVAGSQGLSVALVQAKTTCLTNSNVAAGLRGGYRTHSLLLPVYLLHKYAHSHTPVAQP